MRKTGRFGIYLFGAIFFLAGAGFFYGLVGSTLIDALDMQDWHSANAQLLSADVSSRRKRNDNGGHTTMYKVVAQYRYQVNNRSYDGDRPSIDTGSSSEREDHYELLHRMEREKQQYGSIAIWYDPEDPAKSVYSRSLNWRMISMMSAFCGVFMLIGGGIIVYAFRTRRDDLPLDKADPDKPWTSRKVWASPIIYSRAQGSVKAGWFIAVLSVFFFGMFALALSGKHPVANVFAVLFAILPLLVIKRAIRLQREWNRFNRVPLHLNPYPGVIGGRVGGEIVLPTNSQGRENSTLTLQCIKHWRSRSGGKSKSHRGIVWSEEQNVPMKSLFDGSSLKFQFNVPAGQPSSSKPARVYHEWILSIKGNIEGVDFNRDYELPVFVTSDSQTVAEELEESPLSLAEKHEIAEHLSVSSLGDTIYLETPKSTSAMAFAAIGGLFVIIGIGITFFDNVIFGTVFALLGGVFFALGMWGWGRNCKISVSPKGCDIQVFWFSHPVKHHRLLPYEVRTIKVYRSSSSQSGSSKIEEKYGLRLLTHQGSRIEIGGEFKSKKNATHMKLEIERALKINLHRAQEEQEQGSE